MWYYENGLWTWVNGKNSLGSYGIKGQLSPTNEIGFRLYFSGWTFNNDLYVFGGYGSTVDLDSPGTKQQFQHINNTIEMLQDVWVFNINASMWAWINGSENAIPLPGKAYCPYVQLTNI